MKKIVVFTMLVLILMSGFSQIFAQQNNSQAASILNHYAGKNFATGAIPKTDLDLIIQAGIRAPSARNLQPWHFTVIQNQNLAKQIVSNVVDGNVLIVVSAKGDGKTNGSEILDCALAVENIYLAAQALGYTSRIQTGQMDMVNSKLKTELGLPSGYSTVALIRVGKAEGKVDAVTAASARKKAEELVNYK